MMKAKKSLRSDYLNKRNSMSLQEIKQSSDIICRKIIDSDEYHQAKQLFVYYPLGSEVNIFPLIKQSLEDRKIVCFPKVISKTTLKFYQITSMTEFVKGTFNVMEPTTSNEFDYTNETLIIVPGLVFDKDNYRIGYGGGYYDRFIQKTLLKHNSLNTIGVCYSWQLIKLLPHDRYDQRVERIISERF